MSTTHTLIIGGGLSGLLLSHRLANAGHQVTLLEARETLGGRFRRASQAQPYSSPGLDFIAATSENLELLNWLKAISPLPLHFETVEHRPQIFDEARWKPFAGFGETEFQSVGELSALFGATQSLQLDCGFEQLTRALTERLPVAAKTMHEVTSIAVVDGKVTGVTVNGDKTLTADVVIFTPPPEALNTLTKGDVVADKHRARLAKMQGWTAVTLELQRPTALVEDGGIRYFASSAKEFEPVVGRVFGPVSKWMTLVPAERGAEHEYIGQCIRHIKRQLKRAWPNEAEPTKDSEKIYIQPQAYGQFGLRTKEALRLPEISNLYLVSHLLSTVPGELGILANVRLLESGLLTNAANQLPELSASC